MVWYEVAGVEVVFNGGAVLCRVALRIDGPPLLRLVLCREGVPFFFFLMLSARRSDLVRGERGTVCYEYVRAGQA